MKVNQIATIMNSVFGEVIGDSALFTEDLANVVSVGEVITGSSTFDDNFDKYCKSLVDKVGKTIFVDRPFTASELGLWRDGWEYASVLEKVRCEVPEFTDNCAWNLENYNGPLNADMSYMQDHLNELFAFHPATVQAKYYNMATTFKTVISIARDQLRSALKGAEQLVKFIAMIENRITFRMDLARQELERRTLVNFAAEHLKISGATVIHLKTEIGAGAPATLALALEDADTLRYIAMRITQVRKLMEEPSKLYSASGNFVNYTPEADSRLVLLGDLDIALRFNLYSGTFNEEFVKLSGYRSVPFWQGTGTANTLADRASIDLIPASEGPQVATPDTRQIVTEDNLVAVLFDRDAAMICNDEPKVTSQPNEDGDFVNFFHKFKCSFYNDTDENGVVFVYD